MQPKLPVLSARALLMLACYHVACGHHVLPRDCHSHRLEGLRLVDAMTDLMTHEDMTPYLMRSSYVEVLGPLPCASEQQVDLDGFPRRKWL